MNKFKVGDKVRVVATQDELTQFKCNRKIKTGSFHIITKENLLGNYKLGDFCKGWVKQIFIELADEPEPMKNKWHPHHDLIIKWLENEGSVVTLESGVVTKTPNWNPDFKYTVTVPPAKQEIINKIEAQIKGMQCKIDVLLSKLDELEANAGS